jgi:hypothetical protein
MPPGFAPDALTPAPTAAVILLPAAPAPPSLPFELPEPPAPPYVASCMALQVGVAVKVCGEVTDITIGEGDCPV